MAATRLIPLHIKKGQSLVRCLSDRIGYSQNPEKTEGGELVTAYACTPEFCEQEFLLTKSEYQKITGRKQKHEVIAYQIRQSFKQGEVTPEEANKIGYELAMRYTKGKYAFFVATHTDRAHIHNHIIFNSTSLDCQRKFKNSWYSFLGLQRLSDMICFEHGLSVIEKKNYNDRTKRTEYPRRQTVREQIRKDIDVALGKSPKTMEELLNILSSMGYAIKRGANIAVRGKNQKKFIRFRSLGDGYSEADLAEAITKNCGMRGGSGGAKREQRQFNLLIDIEERMKDKKSPAYQRWATVYNLKQMSQTFLYLREHDLTDMDKLSKAADEATERFNELNTKIKAAEKRLAEIQVLKKHIVNYRKTKDTYVAYRISGYSNEFFEDHREELTLHKTAKDAFDQLKTERLPTIRELNEEYSRVLTQKKADYAEYRKAKKEMRESVTARKNVEMFYMESNLGDRNEMSRNILNNYEHSN